MIKNYSGKPHTPKADSHPIVENFMSSAKLAVNADMNIYDAIDFLVKKGLTGAPVLDEKKELVGFLSEKDCLPLITGDAYYPSQPAEQVSRFMTKDVFVIEPNADLVQVAEMFMEHPIKKVPVVQGKRLIGQVTLQDVMKVVLKQKKTLRPE